MIKRLHWYIACDLAKVTALALIAFTLVMTVFAIIEPLRKQGLDSDQALRLVVCTIPVMVSLTLPVAALFAATIVYGRFSQDNELLACRASGVSTLSLLKPAVVLGALVTAGSLYLSNSVAPRMLAVAKGEVLQGDVRTVVFSQLKKKGCFRYRDRNRDYVLHADQVDEKHGLLGGCVLADLSKPKEAVVLAASAARISFHPDADQGETYVEVLPYNARAFRSSEPKIDQELVQPWREVLPNLVREKPAWYEWGKLLSTLKDPSRNAEIRHELVRIQRAIRHDLLADDVEGAISANLAYDKLSRDGETYVIAAASAKREAVGKVRLLSTRGSNFRQPVQVRVSRHGREQLVVTAESGTVEARWSQVLDDSVVTIRLDGPVAVRLAGEAPQDQQQEQRRSEWSVGQLALPPQVAAAAASVTLNDIVERPDAVLRDPARREQLIKGLNNRTAKLINEIIAEMHGRVAYGSSCFLLVVLGAALGLIFRGGHFISAFAISVVPAAVVIVMVIMGKEMVRNPRVDLIKGLAAIWTGVAALAAANVATYLHLGRK